mmetsp:Transcript_27007/g.58788  ORF Transcript_27007/g.58788 Transcript_27007/m.58788 type:complete len:354 (+) Transcript_27007:208-1269(+)
MDFELFGWTLQDAIQLSATLALGYFACKWIVSCLCWFLGCFSCCCCRCCPRRCRDGCQRTPAQNAQRQQPITVVEVAGLQDANGKEFSQNIHVLSLSRRKEVLTSYMLLGFGGLLGVHHFYLERYIHGILSLYSLNFCFLGFVFDFLFLPQYVDSANRSRSRFAVSDDSKYRVCFRLPMCMTAVFLASSLLFLGGPEALQTMGLCDVEQHAAGTVANPYDMLEVPRGCTQAQADFAYKQIKDQLGHECNKACRQELRRARDFASGRLWRESVSATGEKSVMEEGSTGELLSYKYILWKGLATTLYSDLSTIWFRIETDGSIKEAFGWWIGHRMPATYQWWTGRTPESGHSSEL